MGRCQAKHAHVNARFHVRRKDWFVNQKRSLRRKQAVALGWIIKSNPDGVGVFHSHQYISGSRSWRLAGGTNDHDEDIADWADIYFLSAKPRADVFFNATIHTVADVVASELENEAEAAVDALLTEDEKNRSFGKTSFQKIAGRDFYEMVSEPDPTFAVLGGLTRYGAQAQWLRHALAQLPQRQAFVHCRTDLSYCYGVGLDMATDAVGINVLSIVHAINQFRAHGENDFRIPTPIHPHLPAIRAKVWRQILVCERMDARNRGLAEPNVDVAQLLTAEELRHFHNGSVAVKV